MRFQNTQFLISSAYFLTALLGTPVAFAQERCESPARCMTKDRANALVDAKCGELRAKASKFDGLRLELDEANAGWQMCRGAGLTLQAERDALTLQVQMLNAEIADRWPWWVWFSAGVFVTGAAAAGALLAL